MGSSPSLLDSVVIPLVKGKDVLDAGCGFGKWGYLIFCNYWEAGYERPPVVDGFDAFPENVSLLKNSIAYRKVWDHLLPNPIEGTWDTVIACELIEHVPQDQVEATLSILEKAASKRIILTTPNHAAYRDGVETVAGFNKFEAHLSYVDRKFFRKRGYKLIGCGIGYSIPARIIRKFFPFLLPFLLPFSARWPWLAENIVAYKDVG